MSTSSGPFQKSGLTNCWTQPGVRPRTSNDEERWICQFSKSGPPNYLMKVCFGHNRSLCWLTERPPRVWWSSDQNWKRVLECRGWVTEGAFALPGLGSAWRSWGHKKNQWNPSGASRPFAYWEDLAKWPNDVPWEYDTQAWSPISRIADQVVVDFPDYDPLATPQPPRRTRHARMKQLSMYKRRIFAHWDDEAWAIPPPLLQILHVIQKCPGAIWGPQEFPDVWGRRGDPFQIRRYIGSGVTRGASRPRKE